MSVTNIRSLKKGWEGLMKSQRTIMEILEAFDLVGTYCGAAALAGCAPNTVRRYVELRRAGDPIPKRASRARIIDEYMGKIEELVARSQGQIQAKKVHEKLVAMGFTGSQRTTDKAVREAKQEWRACRARVHRPWIAEPGMWAQYDFGDGPMVEGVKTVLFVAWLPFSRYRFVYPLLDRKAPSVMSALDAFFRHVGGVPTYVLTDNERTVTIDQVCNLPVRNGQIVSFARWYGTTIHTCVPYDPASKGGVENAVKIAKADLVPRATNLRPAYESFAEFAQACRDFTETVNQKPNTRGKIPAVELDRERQAFHPIPEKAYEIALGAVRTVGRKTPMIQVDNVQYSVPWTYMGQKVFARIEQVDHSLVITWRDGDGMIHQIARHQLGQPGQIIMKDSHFPPDQPTGPLKRKIMARSGLEKEFLDIGDGAVNFVRHAAQAGVTHLKDRLELICAMKGAWSTSQLNQALNTAAQAGRFLLKDIESILATLPAPGTTAPLPQAPTSFAQGTASWAAIGQSH